MGRTKGKKAGEAPAQTLPKAFSEVVRGKSADDAEIAEKAMNALKKSYFNPTSADIGAAKFLVRAGQAVDEKNVALTKIGLKITPRTRELSNSEISWLRTATQTRKSIAEDMSTGRKDARPEMLPIFAKLMPEHAAKELVVLARNPSHASSTKRFLSSSQGRDFIGNISEGIKNGSGSEIEHCLSESEKSLFLLASDMYLQTRDSEKMHASLITIGNEFAERMKKEMTKDSLHNLLEVEGVTPTGPNLKAASELLEAGEPVSRATVELKKAGLIRCQETLLLGDKQLTAINSLLHRTGYMIYAMRNAPETYAEELPTLVKYVPVYAAERMCELASQPFVPPQLSESLKRDSGKKFLGELALALETVAQSYEESPVLTVAEKMHFASEADKFILAGNDSALEPFISELALLGEKIKERKKEQEQKA